MLSGYNRKRSNPCKNGEAPTFVVTVSGQKIANANLKAGVYFVVADGNSMSVVVR